MNKIQKKSEYSLSKLTSITKKVLNSAMLSNFHFFYLLLPVLFLGTACHPKPPPNDNSYECHGSGCSYTCPDGGYCGPVDCSNSHDCTAECPGDAECAVLNCRKSGSCDLHCSGNVLCNFQDCRESDNCDLSCTGSSNCPAMLCNNATSCHVECSGDVDCAVDCTETHSCRDISCTGSSRCLLNCTDSSNCGYAECTGNGETTCPNGIIVCNRECPYCGDGECEAVAGENCDSCSDDCGGC